MKVSGRVNVTNWQQFEPEGEKLKELVDGIKAANLSLRRPPNGYIMNVPGGDQVGVMYATTLPTSATVIRLKDGNLIAVTPHNDEGFAPGP